MSQREDKTEHVQIPKAKAKVRSQEGRLRSGDLTKQDAQHILDLMRQNASAVATTHSTTSIGKNDHDS